MNTIESAPESFCSFFYDEQTVRAGIWDGLPVVAAIDVCNCLGLTNSRQALTALDEDEKITVTNPDGNPRAGIPHQLTFINEAGVFRLIFSSRKEEAKTFQRWVFHEVLPKLRRDGTYTTPAAAIAPPVELPPIIVLHRQHFRDLLAQGVHPDKAVRSADRLFDSCKKLPRLAEPGSIETELALLLIGMQPGLLYSCNDLAGFLPSDHYMHRRDKSDPARASFIGKLMNRAIGMGKVKKEGGRLARYILREPESSLQVV